VTYDPQDEVGFSEIIMGVTSDYGAELFVDTVGSVIFKESLKSMSQFGTLVALGDIHGQTIDFHLSEVLFKDLKILGFTGTTRKAIELAQQDILLGSIKPIIADIINLNDLSQAKKNMENSSAIGRILVNLHDVNR
jgi:NADPH:quinone reductase-like Zn-dependent oxidoreductase